MTMPQITVIRGDLGLSKAGTTTGWIDETSLTQRLLGSRKPSHTSLGRPQRGTTTNTSVDDILFLAPPPETIRAGYPPLSIEDRVDAMVAEIIAQELAPFERDPGPYRRVIHEALRSIDPSTMRLIPDRELRARIKRILVLEMMRDLFADLSDDEIDEVQHAARTGDLFR